MSWPIELGLAKYLALTAALLATLAQATAGEPSHVADQAATKLPVPLVYLRDVDATIAQDIRYATSDNFTGARVDGYESGECILTQQAAEALKNVQTDLKGRKLSLKVYDCYRPKRAVDAFMKWAQQPKGDAALANRFHPRTSRESLVSLGYIAAVSGHSRADTVDLTLVAIPPLDVGKPGTSQSYGACTEAADKREPDNSIDMGTAFDCFDTKSHTLSAEVTSEQGNRRNTLVRAMERRGFRNYSREWWHFTYGAGTGPAYDFPIIDRQAQPSR